MVQNKDLTMFKLLTADIGLFVTLAFKDKDFTENDIYSKLLNGKLQANLGYIYENARIMREILLYKCVKYCYTQRIIKRMDL